MPKRIQRKRTKGWRMPPNTVYVGSPTDWGNLWRVGHVSCGCRSAIVGEPLDASDASLREYLEGVEETAKDAVAFAAIERLTSSESRCSQFGGFWEWGAVLPHAIV